VVTNAISEMSTTEKTHTMRWAIAYNYRVYEYQKQLLLSTFLRKVVMYHVHLYNWCNQFVLGHCISHKFLY
jgi:hypothetical protein